MSIAAEVQGLAIGMKEWTFLRFDGVDKRAIVVSVCEATSRNISYNGTSPSQGLLGRSRNPLIDTSEASPMITSGSAFEEHLARKTVAAQQFHAADAKHILHMAARARSRVISQVQAGQLVYYFRRGKKKSDQGYRGPAKVIAVEKGSSGAPAVAWLS